MEKETKPIYGGQAIVEGVMFGGRHTTVSMIRRNDDTLDTFEVKRHTPAWITKAKKIPFVRGIAGIVEASINGSKHLNFSTDRYDVDPSEDDNIEPAEKSSKLTMILGVAAVAILSFIFGKLIFTLVPTFIANLFTPLFPGHVAQNLLEGGFKLILLLAYIYLLSFTPLIRRVFQYHGAEHKVINTYEAGLPLTVQNVQAHSRLHYRCGSSFILFTVIVGVGIYLFLPFDSLLERVIQRIVLIPVVLGVSFEVLQLTNRLRDIPILKWLGYPGLALQLLTTKEPSDKQTEVAIASFEEMLKREETYTTPIKADIV
ncbi:DUF1385 domain-containing protein [Alkalicoccobacillus porphyridii]|uniref:DUF1385 domain-containing protein n=1 Tax=Alkalicoccobacillus porphyridii TaxID=2597270 RepID=A0A553ZTA3_9BACI|nr:DUF1385 domain-containing protein [Alkalicoccobacillus porphyridii]TSB44699.1 DUF1385 domain-containing protein [Alkalicoccobacillus porphyridii]